MRLRSVLLAAAASLLAALSLTTAARAAASEPRPSATQVGDWQWPLAGTPVVDRGFDPPPLPWLAGHRGVDLRARASEAVRAAGPGAIGFAGMVAGRGVVTVQHVSGLVTTYEPVDATVRAGARVDAGVLIGHVTAGHGDCGPGWVCLHWGLRRGTAYLDPLQLVRPTRMRLLPIFGAAGPSRPVAAAAAQREAGQYERPEPAQRQRDGPPVLPLVALGGLAAAGVIAVRRASAG